MRINKPDYFDNDNLVNVMKIKDVEPAYRFPMILDDKDKIKNIKKIEMMIRGSLEYKEFIKYLKDTANMHKCRYLKNVIRKGKEKITIEVHHEPFTLFDLTQIVMDKFLDEGREINHFKIAEEVMKLHYLNMVGLVPLSTTVHQLVHDGRIFIPLQDVYGTGIVDFIKENEKYMSKELKRLLMQKIKISRDICQDQNLSILERKYTYVRVEGVNYPALDQFKPENSQ